MRFSEGNCRTIRAQFGSLSSTNSSLTPLMLTARASGSDCQRFCTWRAPFNFWVDSAIRSIPINAPIMTIINKPVETIPSTPPHHCSNPPHHKRNEPRNRSEPDGDSRLLCNSSCRSCTKKLPAGPPPCRPGGGHNPRHKDSKQPRHLNHSTRKIFQE